MKETEKLTKIQLDQTTTLTIIVHNYDFICNDLGEYIPTNYKQVAKEILESFEDESCDALIEALKDRCQELLIESDDHMEKVYQMIEFHRLQQSLKEE